MQVAASQQVAQRVWPGFIMSRLYLKTEPGRGDQLSNLVLIRLKNHLHWFDHKQFYGVMGLFFEVWLFKIKRWSWTHVSLPVHTNGCQIDHLGLVGSSWFSMKSSCKAGTIRCDFFVFCTFFWTWEAFGRSQLECYCDFRSLCPI